MAATIAFQLREASPSQHGEALPPASPDTAIGQTSHSRPLNRYRALWPLVRGTPPQHRRSARAWDLHGLRRNGTPPRLVPEAASR
jgi:hypothetical protein